MKKLLFAVLSVGMLIATSVSAQDILRIVAVVNDEAISALDLEHRLRLFMANARLADNPDTRNLWRSRVLRVLVDERLKLQEAKRLGIYVSESEIEDAIYKIGFQPNWGSLGLEGLLQKEGINRSVIVEELRAQIAWQRIISQKLVPTIFIGDDEIDKALERMEENKGRSERKLLEIFLSMDTPDQSQEVMRTAQTLVNQLRSGAPFGPLARQFSEGSTATQGGEIGWVQQGQLAPELDAAIVDLQTGSVSDAIRSSGGVYIIKLLDQRSSSFKTDDHLRLKLAQLVIPIAEQSTATVEENAKRMAKAAHDQPPVCENLSEILSSMGAAPSSGDLGWLNINELSLPITEAVKTLEVGESSAPLTLDNSVHVFFVCERAEPKVLRPKREDIASSIGQRRLMMMARRYMRDLRRDAFLDESRL